MVFCNVEKMLENCPTDECHNPYFNRWFSAIGFLMKLFHRKPGHNPYFNRWFSAILSRIMYDIFI